MIPKIKENKSKDIFALFVALNVVGYDDENNPKGMSPERKRLRKTLSKYREEWIEKYPRLYETVIKYHPYILLKSPPNYFRENLKLFSNESAVKEFWKLYSDSMDKESKAISALIKKEVGELAKLLCNHLNRIEKVEFTVNLLDAHWRGYSFKIGNIAHIILGPGATDNNSELIRHELLHSLIPNWSLPANITEISANKRAETLGYGNKSALNNEYLVHSINLIYRGEVLRENMEINIKELENTFPNISQAIKFVKSKIKKRLIHIRTPFCCECTK